ncbi:aminoglycoside phosphotransferase/kinase family protein [Sunxiuqinia dokdonensis]|uniref:Aminoglycoside phosphotransferase domain-containing protein n=1 Tax=Sunxiuqinia dokdonensis TaxID=1409788 RepID=A0A0L8VD54_9BACT|nr:hypothetical protein [Sunxiuqinia dokdonensis]KOH46376.1 hypothetical protein NC99_08070 [Sunxiuqinia dokdonensis]
MQTLDYFQIIRRAWAEFDDRHEIKGIYDVSAHVSTNQVYKISFYDRQPVFAKLSEYGNFEHFKEDHVIINNLANNLEAPYENFLARSLVKRNDLFIYRYYEQNSTAWVVFYNPIKIKHKMPRRLEDKHIRKLGRELARFHKACTNVANQLPNASKTVVTDIHRLLRNIDTGKFCGTQEQRDLVKQQCESFLIQADRVNYSTQIETIPVFVDWNIGNFSVRGDGKFYSRWDYDWFRESTRVMDFYFFSRVVSDVGDRTVFSYGIDTLMEDRFIMFLKEYHRIFPLNEAEVRLIREAYRFFILNYVIKDGTHFFLPSYARKLQKEAYDLYIPAIDTNYQVDKLLKALKI